MDPYSQYNRQLEFYNYVEQQRENYVDLTSGKNDSNESIVQFAKILFNKSKKNLDQDLSGILVDETMDIADIFCMVLELFLYGFDILKDGKDIFSTDDSTDDIFYTIRSYIKSAGFDIEVHQDFIDEEEVCLYRDRKDYFCEIVPKPPKFLCHPGWYVLNYRLIQNKKFIFSQNTPLEKFKAFYISSNKNILLINFKFSKGK